MHSAILYLRVSTDEQANKGYSLKYQVDILTQYCTLRDIKILNIYVEDHSAKTFIRPTWNKLMSELKVKRTPQPNLILFTKWDRFSRNTGDSYAMIKTLRILSVEPQAIEQPLDLSVPENKMMLAFYLAVPEVENDRRGINVKNGMYKARQEGRWLGQAPIGYKNQYTADNTKYITPVEPTASIIKHAFEQLSKGLHTVDEVHKEVMNLGLNCCRSNFYNIIRNPAYAGNIRFKDYNNQTQIIPGQHVGIISQSIFDKVQTLTFKKKGARVSTKGFLDQFLLRGFIFCPKCYKRLTSSTSAGRSKKYDYYHCNRVCGFRLRADKVNLRFFEALEKMTSVSYFNDFYNQLLQKTMGSKEVEIASKCKRSIEGVKKFEERLSRLKDLLLDNAIDLEDYRITKSDIENKIEMLGEIISSCIKSKNQLLKDSEKIMYNLYKPLNLFSTLAAEPKREWLSIMLTSNWIWNENDINGIFKSTVKNGVWIVSC